MKVRYIRIFFRGGAIILDGFLFTYTSVVRKAQAEEFFVINARYSSSRFVPCDCISSHHTVHSGLPGDSAPEAAPQGRNTQRLCIMTRSPASRLLQVHAAWPSWAKKQTRPSTHYKFPVLHCPDSKTNHLMGTLPQQPCADARTPLSLAAHFDVFRYYGSSATTPKHHHLPLLFSIYIDNNSGGAAATGLSCSSSLLPSS